MSQKTIAENLPVYNNVLLISGTGRNVGKTTLAVQLIEHFRAYNIIGVKISPHFHPFDEDKEKIIYKTGDIIILEEHSAIRSKDSGRMLRAGAKRVFFIMAKDAHLAKAFAVMMELLTEQQPLIIESAALRNYIRPGVFVLLDAQNTAANHPQKNAHLRPLADFVPDDFTQAANYLKKHLNIDPSSGFSIEAEY